MDYETFISENMQEVTKELNDVIQSFKAKRLKISFDFIDTLSKKIDVLENTNQKEFFIQSFIFENIVSDLENINKSIEQEPQIINDDYLLRECFNASILEGILSNNYNISKSHKEYLFFVEVNQDYLDKKTKAYTTDFIINKKILNVSSLKNLKNWCFESFNTPKFYFRKYIYLYFYKNRASMNLLIDPKHKEESILNELLEAV